jgi:hypothetical protein
LIGDRRRAGLIDVRDEYVCASRGQAADSGLAES